MSERDDDIQLPPHLYVPGFTPRHCPRLFDEIKETARENVPARELHKTLAFKAGRRFFEKGFFWECHEVLEEVWIRTHDPSPERDMVLALTQLANARLKLLMHQPRAAWRLCDMVETHLSRCPRDQHTLGLMPQEMLNWVTETRAEAKAAM